MNNLIPHQIANHAARQVFQGSAEGTVLYINITGFHRIAEDLIPQGSGGKDKIAGYLQEAYPAVSEAVYQRGGEILSFKGNALTILFPGEEKISESLYSAMEIRRIVQQLEIAEEDPQGKKRVYTRMGLAYGPLSWIILDGPSRKSWTYRGTPLEKAREAEYWCRKNEIILDPSLQNRVDSKEFILRPVEAEYQKLAVSNRDEDPVIPGEIPEIPREVAEIFYPPSVIDLPAEGKVQTATLLMTSFQGGSPSDQEAFQNRAETFLQIGQSLGGLCEGIECSNGDGEGLMIFGFAASSDHRRDALEAAAQLQEALDGRIRTSVHHGRIYLTQLGNASRCGFCVLGSQVSLSGQLLQKSSWGESYLLADTAEGCSEGYSLTDQGKQQFKRRGTPLPVLRLEGKTAEGQEAQPSQPAQPAPTEQTQKTPPQQGIRERITRARTLHQENRLQEALTEMQLARREATDAGETDLLREILPLYLEFLQDKQEKQNKTEHHGENR